MILSYLRSSALILVLFTCFVFPHNLIASTQIEGEFSESIPFKNQRTATKGTFHKVVLVSMVAVALVFGVGISFRKRLFKKGSMFSVNGTRIKLAESKRITPRMTIFLVNVDGNDYLLVQNGEQVQLVRHDESQ